MPANLEPFSDLHSYAEAPELWAMTDVDELQRWPRLLTSVATIGPPRPDDGTYSPAERTVMAGNMSLAFEQVDMPLPDNLSDDEHRLELKRHAELRINRYLGWAGIAAGDTAVMYHQGDWWNEDLVITDVDEHFTPGASDVATVLPVRSDLFVTRDPRVALACRPADCAVVGMQGLDGNQQPILAMGHYGWKGCNVGYLDATLEHLTKLGVTADSLRVSISPGIRAESYPYYSYEHPVDNDNSTHFRHPDRKLLFTDVTTNEDLTDPLYLFGINVRNFIVSKLVDFGMDESKIFDDHTDTGRHESGHSSHHRTHHLGVAATELTGEAKQPEPYSRDLVVATMGLL